MRESLPGSRTTRDPFTILVIDDDPTDTERLLHAIEQADLKVNDGVIDIQVRSSAEGALQLLEERPVDLVLTDVVMRGLDGLDLVNQIQKIDRDLPILVVTRLKGVRTAVDAIKRGAYDYVLKPVNPVDLGMRLHQAIRTSEILRYNSAFKRTVRYETQAGGLVGAGEAFQQMLKLVRETGQTRSTVLITGETGTGKGMIARAIHEQSQEHDRTYQVIDCTTMPEGMIESELFGHVRGAFTGAISDKPGLIELAEGGTVFLDEIGDLPLSLQAKLLHVLEENEIRRVGATRTKAVETRFIAATNQDLEEKVRAGAFRKDLYYRLAVVVIHVPPLRERKEDIPPIARHLCAQFGREMNKPHCVLEASAIEEMLEYAWPGNVRELRNVIERAVMIATENEISCEEIRSLLPASGKAGSERPRSYASMSYVEAKNQVLGEFTAEYLKEKLAVHGGHLTKAAEASGLQRQYFSTLVKRYLGDVTNDKT